MPKTTVARSFLALNATFSTLCGFALLLFPTTATDLLLADPPGWSTQLFMILGGGLLMFAAALGVLVVDRYVSRPAVLVIVALDAGWVAGSMVLLVMAGHTFTVTGYLVVVDVALAVAFFAIGQTIGAFRIVPPLGKAVVRSDPIGIRAEVSRKVQAPASVVWSVMSDHPGYADVASNLSKVEVLKGAELGMVRKCAGRKGESWTEVCDLYQEGEKFGFKVETQADDYPYPFSALLGRWGLRERGDSTEFYIHILATPKGGWLARKMMLVITRMTFQKVLIDLADAWAARMEREASEVSRLRAAE